MTPWAPTFAGDPWTPLDPRLTGAGKRTWDTLMALALPCPPPFSLALLPHQEGKRGCKPCGHALPC